MHCTPQNGHSTYQKGGNLFPLSTSEWTDSGGDHLSQATPVVKQEPTDNGEYGNSVIQSVETTQTNTVYNCTQLTSSGASTSHPIMSDTNVGVLKQEQTDNGGYENSVTKSLETTHTNTVSYHSHLASSNTVFHPIMSDPNVEVVKQELTDNGEYEIFVTKNEATSERTVLIHHSSLVSSVAPASPSVISSNIVTSSGDSASLSVMSSNIVTSSGAQALQSVLSTNNIASVRPSPIQGISPTKTVALKPLRTGPQLLKFIRRGNSLILQSAAALPSTVTPNIQNPLFTFAHPVGLNLQSDSNLPPTIPVAANVSNVDQGGSVALQPMLEPVSVIEWSSRGQQVSSSFKSPSVTTAGKQTPSTNSGTGSHNRGAGDKQRDEGCKQMDEKEEDIKQNGDSSYQKGDSLFPLSISEWTDSGGDHLSQATPVVKQEPTENGEYENSVMHGVETTQSKTVYHCTQLSSSGATSHSIMSDINVEVVKQEPTDKGEYENSVTKSVNTTQSKTVSYHQAHLASSDAPSHPIMPDPIVGVVKQEPADNGEYENYMTRSKATSKKAVSHQHSPLVSSGAPASLSVMSSNIVTSSGAPASLSVMSSNIVTSGAPALQSVLSTNNIASVRPSLIQGISPTKTVARKPLRTGPQLLKSIRRGNSLILESVSALPSTATPNLPNTSDTLPHPVVLNLLSRGQQVSMSPESPSVLGPITTAVKQVIPSTNTPTGSHNRGADGKQTDEGCKQTDEKMFNQNEKLEAHMRTHTGEEPYQCDVCCNVCGKAFFHTGNLNRHMLIHTGDRPYVCDVCGETYNQKETLRYHMRTHPGEEAYKGDVCLKTFNCIKHLPKQMTKHIEKPYRCDVCGKAFHRAGRFEKHMRIHTGDKPFKCDVCGKAFHRNRYLQRHKRIHNGGKPFKCDVCGKAFSQMGSLQRHKTIHTGDRPYKCGVCGKAFKVSAYLRKHMMIHTGDKPYKCEVCGKAFINAGNLQTHMRIHTGEKPYKCDVCEKAFNRARTLQEHMRIHTGEKPYKCGACGKTFRWKVALQTHISTHTGE